MSKSRSFNWIPILVEAALVVLGVFVALLANEWRENSRRQGDADALLVAIGDEMARNYAAVSRSVEYHGDLVSRFSSRPDAPALETPTMEDFNRGFIAQDDPFSNAWDMALAADAARYMPVEAVIPISKVYQIQGEYLRERQVVGGFIFEAINERGITSILDNWKNHVQLLATFLYMECGLVSDYAEALAILERDPGAAAPEICQYFPRRE